MAFTPRVGSGSVDPARQPAHAPDLALERRVRGRARDHMLMECPGAQNIAVSFQALDGKPGSAGASLEARLGLVGVTVSGVVNGQVMRRELVIEPQSLTMLTGSFGRGAAQLTTTPNLELEGEITKAMSEQLQRDFPGVTEVAVDFERLGAVPGSSDFARRVRFGVVGVTVSGALQGKRVRESFFYQHANGSTTWLQR